MNPKITMGPIESLLLAATIALLTAALTVVGKMANDIWAQYRERKAIAAALRGEVGAYLRPFEGTAVDGGLRALAELDRDSRARRLRGLHPLPTGHPGFSKIADKIALLPPAVAVDVSSFYNYVDSMRLMFMNLSSEGFLEAADEIQVALIHQVARGYSNHVPVAQSLLRKLKAISGESFWQFLRQYLGKAADSG